MRREFNTSEEDPQPPGRGGGRHNRVPKFLKEKTLAIRSTHLEVARPFPDCFEERQGIGTILCAAGVSKMQQ